MFLWVKLPVAFQNLPSGNDYSCKQETHFKNYSGFSALLAKYFPPDFSRINKPDKKAV